MKTFLTSFCFVFSSLIIGQKNLYITYICFDKKGNFPKPYETKHKTTLNIQNNIAQYQFNRPRKVIVYKNKRAVIKKLQYINNYNIKNNKITEQRLFKNAKLNTSWQSNYNWYVTNETKKIEGYTVKKAIGRSIEFEAKINQWFYNENGKVFAWFTEDIPIPAGPERYCGLPGLILEVSYDRNPYRRIVVSTIEFDKKTTSQINIKDGIFVEDKRIVIVPYDKKHKRYIRQYIESKK